jgi:hypothetical protein
MELRREGRTAMSGEIHVVPEQDNWAVEDGESGIGSIHETREEALQEAEELALERNAAVVVHGGDGQVRDREDPEMVRAESELP